ncbi:MAG: glycosyltransferase family 2 protein [Candidatus Brocadiia bacterium]
MPEPKISIALCTYNGEAWLQPQLESFLAQSRQPDELVACDDRSTDGTAALLRRFAERAPFRVRVEVNERTLGATQNFAKAVGLCTGDLIFLSDQDDVWLPAKVESLARALAASPQAGMAFCDGEVCGEALQPLGYTLWQAARFDAAERGKVSAGRAHEVFLRHSVAHGATLAFRAELRRLALPIPPIPYCGHDYWIALLASAVSEVVPIPDLLNRYRLHGRNVVGIRRRSLREQVRLGRELIESNRAGHEAATIQAAVERLEATPVRPGVMDQMRQKLQHLRRRERMSPRLIGRIPDVAGEAFSGRYSRFAMGWRSIAQDLFLR